MADNLDKTPQRSILKRDKENNHKQMKWDEMNILETYHPENKDYGHMKIDEPKTPYNYVTGENEEDANKVSPVELLRKLQGDLEANISHDADDDNLTPEELAHKHEFEVKRKKHYNEFLAMQRAKELIAQDEEEEEAATNEGAN